MLSRFLARSLRLRSLRVSLRQSSHLLRLGWMLAPQGHLCSVTRRAWLDLAQLSLRPQSAEHVFLLALRPTNSSPQWAHSRIQTGHDGALPGIVPSRRLSSTPQARLHARCGLSVRAGLN
jgi:hypothetical protein